MKLKKKIISIYLLIMIISAISATCAEEFLIISSSWETPVDTAFSNETGIEIAYVDIEDISETLVSRDSAIDIYAIPSHMGLCAIQEKGYFVDLRKSKTLSKNINHLYPAFRDVLLTKNGEIVGWPIDAQPVFFYINTDALNELRVNIPQDWETFLDILPVISESDMMAEGNLRFFDSIKYCQREMLRFFIRQYMQAIETSNQAVDFTSPSFAHIAARIRNEVPREPNPMMNNSENEMVFAFNMIYDSLASGMFPQLAISSDFSGAISVYTTIYIINPYSKKQETALRYMEFISQRNDLYAYYYDASLTNTPIYDQNVLDKIEKLTSKRDALCAKEKLTGQEQSVADDLLMEIKNLDSIKYMISPQDIEKYQRYTDGFLILTDGLLTFDQYMEKLCVQFLDKKLTPGEFASACQRHLNMVLEETK